MTARRIVRRLAWVAPPAVGLLLVVSATIAAAIPLQISAMPWPSPGNYGLPGTPPTPVHGFCNLTETQAIPGKGANQPFMTSLACQGGVTTTGLSALFGSAVSPDFSVPGATGYSSCAIPDSAGYVNTSCGVDHGSPAATIGTDFAWVSASGGYSTCGTGTTCLSGPAEFAENHGCVPTGADYLSGPCRVTGFGVGTNAAVECQVESFTEGSTLAGGFYPMQIRVDCMWESDGSHPFIVASGTDTSTCDNASNGIVKFRSTGGDVHMSETSTCVDSYGNHEAPMPDSYWTGGAPTDQGGCSVVSIVPGGGAGLNGVAGHSYTWTVSYSGDAQTLIVATAPKDATPYAGHFVSLGTAPGVYGYDSFEYTATGSPQDLTWIPTRTETVYPHFYCYGANNQLYDLGTPGGVGNTTECSHGGTTGCTVTGGAGVCPVGGVPVGSVGCGLDLAACLDGTGLGLNPVSWVPGLIKDAGCLFQWAFVPVSINTGSFTSTWTTNFPGSWVTDAVAAFGTLRSGMGLAVAGDNCSAPTLGEGGTSWHGISVPAFSATLPSPAGLCGWTSTNATAGELFGYRTLIRDVASFGVWFGALLAMWRMLPFQLPSPPDGLQYVGGDGNDLGEGERSFLLGGDGDGYRDADDRSFLGGGSG